MGEDKKIKRAQKVYKNMCAELKKHGIKFGENEKDLETFFRVTGDDLPMDFIVKVDAERELVRLNSTLPVTFKEGNLIQGAVATCQLNYVLADGCFDYSVTDGTITYKMTSSYKDSLLSGEVFVYLVGIAMGTVERYNDKLYMLAEEKISLAEFFADIMG